MRRLRPHPKAGQTPVVRARSLVLAVALPCAAAGCTPAAGTTPPPAAVVPATPTAAHENEEKTPERSPVTELFSVFAVDDEVTPIDATTPLPAGATRHRERVTLAGRVHERWYLGFPGAEGDLAARRRALDALSHIALPEGRRFVVGPGGAGELRSFVVIEPPALVADDIASLEEQPDEFGPVIAIELTPSAAQRFHRFTADHLRQRLAIVVEGLVRSAPIVMEPITGGRLHLSLGATDAGADSFGQLLRSRHPRR